MKTIKIFFLTLILLWINTTHAEQFPQATGYVNDFANLLSQDQGKTLNDELVEFEKKTSIEIAVVTVRSLSNAKIEDYARGLATEWGIGKRTKNNGVLFLVAPKERKMRIEIASGVHNILTDARANGIRDEIILPQFKAGRLAQGIAEGTHAIMQVLSNNEPVKSKSETTDIDDSTTFLLTICALLLVGYLCWFSLKLFKARKYVLRESLSAKISASEQIAQNPDISKGTRELITELRAEYDSLKNLIKTNRIVNWIKVRHKLSLMSERLRNIDFLISQDIAFAEKARKNGPEILKKIPGILERVEKKLATGKPSSHALNYLNSARSRYAEVTNRIQGMSPGDWLIIYAILSSIESDAKNAEWAHDEVNSEHNYPPSSNASYGFESREDSIRIGGGGGFSGGTFDGGGGSTGDW